MRPTPHAPLESHNPSATPTDPGADERLDENLHYGRAWHRYHYCYRQAEPLRVLDAGCGSGTSSLALARLNPGASVLALDASAAALGLARRRARAAGSFADRIEFAAHDLTTPLPEDRGRFDFVVCRQVLGHSADPDRLLQTLAETLAPGGILLATFPSRHGSQAARALRRAVDALATADAPLEDRARIGLELVQALRVDHPIRQRIAPCHAQENLYAADAAPDLTRAIVDALDASRAWSLDEAVSALDAAGLTFLYAATPGRWQVDRAFDPGALPATFRDHVDRLDPDRLSRLIDALDPSAFDAEYALYARPPGDAPAPPTWPRTRRDQPATFEALIPHVTGLARPVTDLPPGTAAQGRTLFRTVSGALGELDRMSVLRLAAVDGRRTCGAIDQELSAFSRASDHRAARQDCWINLADSGLLLLEPPAKW